MTTEYSSPPFMNAVPLGPSSLEGTLLVRSIQTAFFWFSLHLSPSGKWSKGSPKINGNVRGW
jgi:hypothetical protein